MPSATPCQALALVLLVQAVPAVAQETTETKESTTIGGYGEIHYTNPRGRNTPAEVNLRRFVIYLAHSFNDRLAFRSELEVEDAKVEGGSAGGEVALEQAFLDYRLSDAFTVRTGLVLPPIGIVNETHEPPTFNGVERPAFDHDVIPTTWREIGVGIVGRLPVADGWTYRLYVVNGLKASGFSDAAGIRGGRQEGREASFANPSLTGRLEWARPAGGLRLGGSFWYGGTTAGDTLLGRGTFDAPITVLSADARYQRGALALRAVVATVSVSDADAINALYGSAVGSRIAGGYLEGAYEVVRHLSAFVRHDRYDTQAAVPAGTSRDRAFARRITTSGLAFRPTWNTVFKGDYTVLRAAAGTGEGETLRLGVGYQF